MLRRRDKVQATRSCLLVAALILCLGPLSELAQAQNQDFFRQGIGLYSGRIWFSGLEQENEAGDEFELEAGQVVGMQGELWLTPRWGVRLNGSFADRSLELEPGGDLLDDFPEAEITQDVNVWLTDASALFRVISPAGSSRFAPFVTVGAGTVFYSPEEESTLPLGAGRSFEEATEFAGVVGMGVDIIPNTPTKNFGAFIRMELVDHIAFGTPIGRAGDISGGDDRSDENTLHNLRLNLGFVMVFGIDQ